MCQAWRAGAAAVKLFPASTGGPDHLRQLRAPLPEIPLVAVGGVGIDEARDYLDAGARAVGIGSPLLRGADQGPDSAGAGGPHREGTHPAGRGRGHRTGRGGQRMSRSSPPPGEPYLVTLGDVLAVMAARNPARSRWARHCASGSPGAESNVAVGRQPARRIRHLDRPGGRRRTRRLVLRELAPKG